jgi:hypothetical protein
MSDESPSGRKVINVSSKSSIDLTLQLKLAKEKFQRERSSRGGQVAAHSTSSSATRHKATEPREIKEDKKVLEENELYNKSQEALRRKAKLYKRIKRGDGENDGENGEGLGGLIVPTRASDRSSDFSDDQSGSSSHSSDEDVEITDSFGRTRLVSKSKAHLYDVDEDEDNDDDSKPKVARPTNLIYGDAIQHDAFKPDEVLLQKIMYKEDQDVHYDADWEIRDRGVGFYQFSSDKRIRQQQMESIKNIRDEAVNYKEQLIKVQEMRTKSLENRRQAIQEQRSLSNSRIKEYGVN